MHKTKTVWQPTFLVKISVFCRRKKKFTW